MDARTRATGPGMMTGQILSGVTPFIAVRGQILVMCMIVGSAGLTTSCDLVLQRPTGGTGYEQSTSACHMAKRILVIGNSDGIGAAVTTTLIARGDDVVGVSRSPGPLGDDGPRHEVMDVTDAAYPALLERLVCNDGPFDACIYCVGVGSELELSDLSREARVFEVNLTAMVRTLEVLTPHWLERRSGHFIGLSSLADVLLNPGAPSYSASKAGFSSYLLGIGLRLRRHGIAVTNVRFGFVDTKMAKALKKPLLMTPDRAAEHVLRCLETRPLQLSVPRSSAAFVWAARCVQTLRLWFT